MKTFKKWFVLALAGVLAAFAVAVCSGCFGFGGTSGGGSGSGGGTSSGGSTVTTPDTGNGGGTATAPSTGKDEAVSALGTWKLSKATDARGNALSITQATKDSIYLVVESASATLYFMDDDPFSGPLVRYEERDSHYASLGTSAKAYKLQGSSSYWELAFITSGSTGFWYLEVGDANDPECLYLTKTDSAAPAKDVDPKVGTWTLASAIAADGSSYNLTDETKQQVKLVVKSDGTATFYYFDNDPFNGTLKRDKDGDAGYATSTYDAECYHLTAAGGGSYWEIAFITKKDGSTCFWYLEVGEAGKADSLFLAK